MVQAIPPKAAVATPLIFFTPALWMRGVRFADPVSHRKRQQLGLDLEGPAHVLHGPPRPTVAAAVPQRPLIPMLLRRPWPARRHLQCRQTLALMPATAKSCCRRSY